jgi:hypothetical protein
VDLKNFCALYICMCTSNFVKIYEFTGFRKSSVSTPMIFIFHHIICLFFDYAFIHQWMFA